MLNNYLFETAMPVARF